MLHFQGGAVVKNPLASAEDAKDRRVRSLGAEDPWRRQWQPAPGVRRELDTTEDAGRPILTIY